ncbi:MAG: cytochrome-c oxidase, cbb3-type subunit II [Wenzhouxiangellaceae bacterium]|nr:cytochrome-c oxidase, cbb3-type subunit II [Wenzhouxiangellaceae bacterium]
MAHEAIEKNVGLMAVLILVVISLGGLAQIIPLMFRATIVEPADGVEPYGAVELAGRDIYVREGCYGCHSQQIRPFRSETERYGHYSVAGESVYDRPFQWGSKRTGPDLARVGGKYSDDWHELHLLDPRAVVPDSNMPAYPWLAERTLDPADIQRRMRVLKSLGDPYTDEQIEAAADELVGVTEMEALIAYLQDLGTAWTGQRVVPRVTGGDS